MSAPPSVGYRPSVALASRVPGGPLPAPKCARSRTHCIRPAPQAWGTDLLLHQGLGHVLYPGAFRAGSPSAAPFSTQSPSPSARSALPPASAELKGPGLLPENSSDLPAPRTLLGFHFPPDLCAVLEQAMFLLLEACSLLVAVLTDVIVDCVGGHVRFYLFPQGLAPCKLSRCFINGWCTNP